MWTEKLGVESADKGTGNVNGCIPLADFARLHFATYEKRIELDGRSKIVNLSGDWCS